MQDLLKKATADIEAVDADMSHVSSVHFQCFRAVEEVATAVAAAKGTRPTVGRPIKAYPTAARSWRRWWALRHEKWHQYCSSVAPTPPGLGHGANPP